VSERKLPPFTEVAMASLALIVAGGIYLSSHIPKHVPLTPAVILLALSALLMVGNLASLARAREFAWDRFFEVGKWSLLAYLVIAGLIENAFLQNHVKGGTLVVLTLSLVVFAIHVPALVGFTVARYYEPDEDAAGDGRSPVIADS
jgi:peptidoglycan/LPS O-acetylase OafA/YrhL